MVVTRKQSTPNFPKNEHFLPPDTHTCVSGGKKCLVFGKFAILSFLVTPVLRFALFPYCRRVVHVTNERFVHVQFRTYVYWLVTLPDM